MSGEGCFHPLKGFAEGDGFGDFGNKCPMVRGTIYFGGDETFSSHHGVFSSSNLEGKKNFFF
ncbi:hypothetical protein PGB90_008361 [Kerria lacca]